MRIDIDERWRVRAVGSIDLPLSATSVWGQMRDFVSFISIDPLHVSVRLVYAESRVQRWPPRGTRLVISHRFLGVGPDRVGRIVRWREGRGFDFSDLSARGMRVGFPHVCGYELEPIDSGCCRLHVSARGRWTTRWLPRWMVRLWLWWVIASTERCIASHFRMFRRWRLRHGRATVTDQGESEARTSPPF